MVEGEGAGRGSAEKLVDDLIVPFGSLGRRE